MTELKDVAPLLQINELAGERARWNFENAKGSPPDEPGGLGTPATVAYSFMAARPDYESAADHPGFRPFDSALQEAARQALASWEAVANIRFKEVSDAGEGGAIRFGRSEMESGGLSWFPDFDITLGNGGRIASVKPTPRAGDVWLSTAPNLDDQAAGRYGPFTLVHEIGHAIGLKHPFEGEVTLPEGKTTYAETIMAYTAPPNYRVVAVEGTPESYKWTVTNLYPAVPMPKDIAAVQYLYGANKATNAGDTTYAWEPGERFLTTIWDGGGRDVIDAGNQVLPNVIDLREGKASSIGLRLTEAERRAELPDWAKAAPAPTYDGRDNLWIAHGVTIENAMGGADNDLLIGNAADNRLEGGPGDDTLRGGDGRDTAVLPGKRHDTVLVPRLDGTWEAIGPGGHDLLQEVEAVRFEDGARSLTSSDWAV
jgi:serralysin